MSLKVKIDAIELNQAIQSTGEACLKIVESYKQDSTDPEYYRGYEEGYKKAIEMMTNTILELQQR
jgi:hypothetical protein